MATNPLIDQGSLNRVIGSLSWTNFPGLNITAPFLGREGLGLALDGESTGFINTLTGAVTSPEVYMMITASAHLLKSQPLAAIYKSQMESLSLIGPGTMRPDVAGSILPPYDLVNCAIQSVREMRFNGQDDGWRVTFRGYYVVNNQLWDQA